MKLFPKNIYNSTQFEFLTNKNKFESELNEHGVLVLSDRYKIRPSVIRFRINEWNLDFNEYRSSGEEMIGKFLDNLQIGYIQNTRKVIAPLELDFYLPGYNIAIEVCGLYWHSELRGKDKKYHLNKLQQCEKQGIRLITIFEDELSNLEMIKSRLSHIFNLHTNKIYARKCAVSVISLTEVRDFCEMYHIQGYVNSKIKLGLLFNGKVVAIMTFGKLRKSLGSAGNDDEYELLRYCCIPNHNVTGAASKIFKYFERHYQPKTVISYCDRRWGTGNLYKHMGFIFVHNSSPSYWYMANYCIRKHRYNYRKSVIAESTNNHLTEWEIMQGKGYDRIWDCGTSKWEWTAKL